MSKFTKLTSRLVPLPVDNIDTDQIIPARFLKVTDKNGLGEALFSDWRYNADGSPKEDFVLNQPQWQGAQVLLAGDNFGCGSSREHAPWALTGYGFTAVISTSFADIFRNNALKNGLLPIIVDPEMHRELFDLTEEAPMAEITIDLEDQNVSLPGGRSLSFPIDPFAKTCLLNGVDQLGYIQRFEDEILAFEKARELIHMQHPAWFYDEFKHSGVDYADASQVAVYDTRHQRFREYKKFADSVVASLALGRDSEVVDLGVGTGAFTLNAASHYKKIYAVDVSEAMLEYTRDKAMRAGLNNVVFSRGGFLTYKHAGEPVDAVISSAALHHLPDMWKWVGLLNVAGMLKPGGRFFLFDVVFPMTPNYVDCFNGWVGDFVALVGQEFAGEVETHLRDEYSTFDWIMEGLLRRAGFVIDSCEYNSGMGATYLCTRSDQ
ncbi:MAG: 3-isopropylmalate dehydratase small subunit [Anaerolineales bacterium]|nr:3-isopropylmalate dehydratase small subunit [Anaerolineales bacterium]